MRWGTAAIVALTIMFGGAALATAAGEPGGSPTIELKRCSHSIGPCTEPLVLASGDSFTGNVEVIGFSSDAGFCLEQDIFRGERFTGFATCGGHAAPGDGEPVAISVFGGGRTAVGSTTELLGVTGPDVAGARLRYRRNGETAYEQPVFGHVDSDLAARVGEDAEFGVFAVTVHGCIRSNRMRIVVFDSAGSILGHTSFPDVGDICSAAAPSGSHTDVITGGGSMRFLHAER